MNSISTKATRTTPQVMYMEGGKLLIKGRSIPQDVTRFYQPMIDWATNLEVRKLIVDIDLEYFNSASAKKLLVILKKLDTNKNIQRFIVNWHYEEGDEEHLGNGQIFEKLLTKANFRYSECKEKE